MLWPEDYQPGLRLVGNVTIRRWRGMHPHEIAPVTLLIPESPSDLLGDCVRVLLLGAVSAALLGWVAYESSTPPKTRAKRTHSIHNTVSTTIEAPVVPPTVQPPSPK